MPPSGRSDLLPGTLELLVLKTISIEPMHGYAIAQHIKRVSSESLKVEEGSLYPFSDWRHSAVTSPFSGCS